MTAASQGRHAPLSAGPGRVAGSSLGPVDSWYEKTGNPASVRRSLAGEIRADVAVLGAGYSGLMTALKLAERGYKVAVVEAKQVGWGASGRNGGQIVTAYNPHMGELEHLVGNPDAKKLWDLAVAARSLLADTIERHRIGCDLTWGYVFAAATQRQAAELARIGTEWTHYGHHGLKELDRAGIQNAVASKRYVAGLFDPEGGHLHPLNYVRGLADACERSGVEIFENSSVLKITRDKPSLKTAEGMVTADKLVIVGNALLGRLMPQLARKIAGIGTYIASTQPMGPAGIRTVLREDVAVCDMDFILNYFRRSPDHRLLFGSRVSYSGREPHQLRQRMRQSILRVFPQLREDLSIDQCWGGLVDLTINRLPHIGRLDSRTYFAHGFSGQGVALAGMAGSVIADAIAGQSERFDVFARIPHRSFPAGPLRRPALMMAMLWYRLQEKL